MRFVSRRAFLIALLLGTLGHAAFAENRVVELAIHNGQASPKADVFSVSQGDEVVVRITSDKPLHVHLHGYDIESDVVPNVVTALRFTATVTGRFPVEAHSDQPRKPRPLAYVEVRPR